MSMPVSRNYEDASICFGHQLFKICITAELRILKGRQRGDLQNHFLYFDFQGCRTVEKFFVSESLSKSFLIQYLSVQDLNHLSDYKPTLLKIYNDNLYHGNKNIRDCF